MSLRDDIAADLADIVGGLNELSLTAGASNVLLDNGTGTVAELTNNNITT